jgi:hypothetical protein
MDMRRALLNVHHSITILERITRNVYLYKQCELIHNLVNSEGNFTIARAARQIAGDVRTLTEGQPSIVKTFSPNTLIASHAVYQKIVTK